MGDPRGTPEDIRETVRRLAEKMERLRALLEELDLALGGDSGDTSARDLRRRAGFWEAESCRLRKENESAWRQLRELRTQNDSATERAAVLRDGLDAAVDRLRPGLGHLRCPAPGCTRVAVYRNPDGGGTACRSHCEQWDPALEEPVEEVADLTVIEAALRHGLYEE